MKKVFVFILAFVYITTSAGFTLHMHYCMGKIANWGLGHNHSKTCSKCGMDEKSTGCCKNEYKFFKNNPDQKITESAFQAVQIGNIISPSLFVELTSAYYPRLAKQNPAGHAPSRSCSIAVYIRNCTFLI
jgi:hypothetical protein